MSFDAARPRYTLPFNDREYELLGTFGLIEAVEAAFKESILSVAARCIDLGAGDTSKLLSTVVTASGGKLAVKEAGDAVWATGLESEAFLLLKLHLFAFLRICLAPPADREEKAAEMGKLFREATARPPSRGKRTRSFA